MAPKQANQNVSKHIQNNIQRIIKNNIQENDFIKTKAKNSLAPRISPQLEQDTQQMKYEELDTNRVIQLHQQTTERLDFDR